MLAEQFELRALIGRGSTATVYRAWDRRRGAVMALKVASYEPGRAGPEIAARWEHEAGLLERLDTPHIVRFYGLYYDAPSRSLSLALEYVAGESLASRLARDGALTWETAVGIALAVGRGLTYAHQWLIHRDVKPANILLGRDQRVALTDFGVAKGPGQRSDGQHHRRGPVATWPRSSAKAHRLTVGPTSSPWAWCSRRCCSESTLGRRS